MVTLVLQLSFLAVAFVSAPLRYTLSGTAPSIHVPDKRILLFAKNITDTSPKESSMLVQDSSLVAVDVVSIAMASQLLGLADTLNDPKFWQQGGWFQPMSAMESTLPTLVQRESILTICWLLSALAWKGYNANETETHQSSIASIAVTFCGLRVALGLAMSVLGGHVDFDVWDSIRQCYFAIVLVGSLRFLYSQYIR